VTAADLTEAALGTAKLLAHLDGFTDGEAHARQEIEAAIEQALREATACACKESHCAARNGAETIRRAVRLALHDPHGSLVAHDEQIRAEHHDDLIEHLRAMPNVRVAANGSYTNDRHDEGGHG
jgi:hypothetical protein